MAIFSYNTDSVERLGSAPSADSVLDRISEIEDYISNFPDGIMAECFRHELEELQRYI